MIYIKHRVNGIQELKKISKNYGVEIDLRSYKNKLILNHEPFEDGVIFENWLEDFDHKYLILNVKEEGLEDRCAYLMEKHQISNYFFLDQSMPMLIKTSSRGNDKTAIRYSLYESLETVLNFKGYVEWIWIDYYENYPLNEEIIDLLKKNNFKTCLVSPELQGKTMEVVIEAQKSIVNFRKNIDAVCTKYISSWEKFIQRD